MKNRLRIRKEKEGTPPNQASVCFLIEDNEILLAMKKRGFGVNKWNGVGGKRGLNEKIEDTAIRESFEEIGITPTSLEKVAVLNFYFINKSEWNQQVHAFLVRNWEGEPQESDEMKPKWFNLKDIPFEQMWPADIFWIKEILKGKKVKADILFDQKQKLVEKNIKIVAFL